MRRLRRFGVVALALVMVAASCGSDDGGSSAAPGSATADGGDVDPNGVLRVAFNIAPTVVQFDPAEATSNAHQLLDALYGSLLVDTGNGFEPGLATEARLVDPRTITVELREGLVFSDGTPVDATALKFNLERTNAAENMRGLRTEILTALDHVEVTGELTATIHLETPTGGLFYTLLAGPETMMVSPTAVEAGQDMNTDPVGAGPFLLESAQEGVEVTMTKNPDYYAADDVELAGLEFIHVEQGPTAVNALQAGQVDAAPLSVSLAKNVSDPIVVEELPHPALLILNMCKADPPLDDVRVRQAISFAVDREALAQGIYEGGVEPAWSLRPSGDPLSNPDLDGVYARDLDKARSLLEEAGYPDGFELGMIVSPGNSTLAGELMQAQLAEVGIDLKLQESSDPLIDFYIENRAPTFPINQTRVGLDAFTVLFLPGAFANVCGYSNPQLEQTLTDAMAHSVDSDEYVEGWHDLAEIVADDLPIIPLTFHLEVIAHNSDRVGNLQWVNNSYGNKMANLHEVYVKG